MSMGGSPLLLYHVAFSRDAETDRVVAEVPSLQLADFGADVPEALDRLQAMVRLTSWGLPGHRPHRRSSSRAERVDRR
jgi:hypothetical protein